MIEINNRNAQPIPMLIRAFISLNKTDGALNFVACVSLENIFKIILSVLKLQSLGREPGIHCHL